MFNITSFLRKSVFVWYWYQGVTKLVNSEFCSKSPKSFLTYKKAKMQSSPIQQCTICPQYLRLLPALFFPVHIIQCCLYPLSQIIFVRLANDGRPLLFHDCRKQINKEQKEDHYCEKVQTQRQQIMQPYSSPFTC